MMNAHSIESGIALAATSVIADTLRSGLLREVEFSTETGNAQAEQLRQAAGRAATLAALWHEPSESFSMLFGAALRGGVPAVQARGILIGAFGADYGKMDLHPKPMPAMIAPDVMKSTQICAPYQALASESFGTKIRRTLALAPNSDAKLAELERLAIEAGTNVDNGGTDYSYALDELIEAADAQGLCAKFRRDAIEHVCSMGLKGRPALVRKAVAVSVTRAAVAAVAANDHGQIPLIAELAPAEPYPVQALGAVLSCGANAIARKIQAPIEMAAQSVLAVAALAAQAHADVQLPFGQTRPLSLALVTVASSGDRKTTTDREAAWPVRLHEEDLAGDNNAKLDRYRIDAATWEAEKKKIEADRKLDRAGRAVMLENLGAPPIAPLHPFVTAPEPTIEGLIKAMPRAPGSLGLFSAEGGQFVGGHGMSTDNRLKTASGLSSLWDGEIIKRIRAGDGVSILKGRRLSLHIMIQPDVAAVFLTDPLLRDQGLLSRILVAAPCSMAGTRTYQETAACDDAAIREYGGHILRLLRKPWPLAAGTDNELLPRVLPMSGDAQACWRDFHDETERQIGPGGRLAPVKDFAGKAAEHAARIAGVLTIVDYADALEIGEPEMRDAVALVRWHLGEALRLCAVSMTDPAARRAFKLLEWLRANYPTGDAFPLRDVVRLGPAELRTKEPALKAVRKLIEHGFAREVSAKPLKWALIEAAGGAA